MRLVLIRILCVLALCGVEGARAAEPADGNHRWPPDPKLYDSPGTPVAPGLAVGDWLDETTANRAKSLLPPEMLAHYKSGGFRNRIVSWPPGIINYEQAFAEATRANAEKYVIDPDTGTIVERATGTPPEYIYGIPFPVVADDDPEGGIKALWNQFHVYWSQGSVHTETLIIWASPERVDRVSTQDVNYQYYENQAPRYRADNPEDYSWQFISITKSPVDLEGTVAMSYRYRDPKKRDAVWTYVPALRRVRPVSPANRSDGFLGSDLSQDDGNFFDGKPEDFVWKTVGLRDGLRIIDPDSIRAQGGRLQWMKTGGWHNVWPEDRPAAGYMKEGWKGLAWAPVSAGLVKRKFWVVEGTPRDPYYLYGRLQLWIDAESWIGAYNRKYSWKGELLNTYAVSGYLNHPASREDGSELEWLWSSQHAWQCAENVRMRRATLAGIRARRDGPLDRRVRHDVSQLFSLQSLSRFGK